MKLTLNTQKRQRIVKLGGTPVGRYAAKPPEGPIYQESKKRKHNSGRNDGFVVLHEIERMILSRILRQHYL